MDSSRGVEDIIMTIGGCGKFQISLAVLSHLMSGPIVFTMYSMFISVAVPNWKCGDEAYNSTSENTTMHYSVSLSNNSITNYTKTQTFENTSEPTSTSVMYDAVGSCLNMNGTECKQVLYSGDLNTIVSEWSMVCSHSWVPSLIASIQMGGLLFGNAFGGQLADTLGRKTPLFGSLLMLIISNIIGFVSQGWVTFGIARTLCGISMGTFLTVQYSLATEVTSSKWRAWIFGFPSWPIAACLFALASYLLPDWRKLHLLTAVITIPFLFVWRLVPESFRWYLSHDREKDATKAIRYIAKINKRSTTDIDMKKLNEDNETYDEGDRKKYSFFHLFKTRRLVKITVLLGFNWFNLGLATYSIYFGIQALSGNMVFNLFLFSVITIPASFIPIFLVNKIGRRLTLILSFVFTAIGCLAVGIVQYTNMKGALTNGFAMFASLSIGIAWAPVQMMTQELYPTVIRNIGNGTGNMFARVGAIIGPQLAYLDTRAPGVMYFICCAASIVCILGTLALSETKGKELCDKIQLRHVKDVIPSGPNSDIKNL